MARPEHLSTTAPPSLLILNQMAGPMTWEAAVDLAAARGAVALLTGHPDTLAKPPRPGLTVTAAQAYVRGGAGQRLRCWCRYLWQAWWWCWRWPRDVPLVVFSNPPLAIWLAWALRRVRKQRYAVVVHDIYPDILVRQRICSEASLLVRLWRLLNRWALSEAEVVVTLGASMARTLEQHFPSATTSAASVRVVSPWADCDRLQPRAKADNWFAARHGQLGKLTVMYSGNMGLGHDLQSMLAAARLLRDVTAIHFMFVGAGPKWERVAAEADAANVTVLPWQPESDLPYSLAAADVALVSLEPALAGLAVPSKAYYFLAAGVPVIALCAEQSELSELVTNYHCGTRLDARQPAELASWLRQLEREPQRLRSWKAGACRAREAFSRSVCSARLVQEMAWYLPVPARPQSARVGVSAGRANQLGCMQITANSGKDKLWPMAAGPVGQRRKFNQR